MSFLYRLKKARFLVDSIIRFSTINILIISFTLLLILGGLLYIYTLYGDTLLRLHNYADLSQNSITLTMSKDALGDDERKNKMIDQFIINFNKNHLDNKPLFSLILPEKNKKDIDKIVHQIIQKITHVKSHNKDINEHLTFLEDYYISILFEISEVEKIRNKTIQVTLLGTIIIVFLFLGVSIFLTRRKIGKYLFPFKEISNYANIYNLEGDFEKINKEYEHEEYNILSKTLVELDEKIKYETRIQKQDSASSSVSELTQSLTHAINNPLAIIESSSKMIIKYLDKGMPDKAKEEVAVIADSLKRITYFTHGMKKMIDSDNKTEKTVVDIESIYTYLNMFYYNKMFENNIQFVKKIETHEQLIGIESSIMKIMLILVDNAISYGICDNAIISFVFDSDDQYLYLRILDNGSLPDSMLIYKYFLGEEKAKSLGLFTARKLAEECGYQLYYDEQPKSFVLQISKEKISD